MKPLPLVEEQIWLLSALGELIERCGPESLTRSPIPTPSSRYLPDPIESDLISVHTLCRRLLLYAGLRNFEVTLADRHHATQGPVAGGRGGLWLAEIEDTSITFGFEPRRIEDIDDLLAQMARAVAQAWRAHHDLVDDDAYEEARLVDVTAMYLGFGVFMLNGAHRASTPKAAHEMIGGWWSSAPTGYLSPQSAAWLLTAQLRIREEDARTVAAIERTLGPIQQVCFRASRAEHDGRGSNLRRDLGIYAPETWDPAPPLSMFTAPLKPAHVGDSAPELSPDEPHTVFRIIQTGMHRNLLIQMAVINIVAAIMVVKGGRLGVMAAMMTLGVTAVMALRGRRREHCSHCKHALNHSHVECPGCGGMIRGRIEDRGRGRRIDQLLSEKAPGDEKGGRGRGERVP
ncbi:MAG: hypothetical protein ACE366_02640 [Bradymonadia bacterium]